MFCINVALGSTSWRLLFREEAKAVAASMAITDAWERNDNSLFAVNDEFGQTMRCRTSAIHGVMTEDLDQTKLAHIEMALHQARTQNAAQKMAASDPSLRAGVNQAGPAIISPMGNGFRPS